MVISARVIVIIMKRHSWIEQVMIELYAINNVESLFHAIIIVLKIVLNVWELIFVLRVLRLLINLFLVDILLKLNVLFPIQSQDVMKNVVKYWNVGINVNLNVLKIVMKCFAWFWLIKIYLNVIIWTKLDALNLHNNFLMMENAKRDANNYYNVVINVLQNAIHV